MWWVGYPKASPNHTLSTSDSILSPNSGTTQYHPGQLVALFLRTTAARQNYKGILLYAVNSNETKVGQWSLTAQQQSYAQLYPAHVCQRSLMHLTATNKRYVDVFYFQAPPAGTGTITFRCLIKTGYPNPAYSGDFLWVTNLTLTEGAAKAPQFVALPAGPNNTYTTCDAYCMSTGSRCYPATLASITNPVQAAGVLVGGSGYPCDLAVNGQCNSDTPSVTNGFCAYHSTSCGPTYMNVGSGASNQPVCNQPSDATSSRLCACGLLTSAGSRSPSSLYLVFGLVLGTLFSIRKATLPVLLVVVLGLLARPAAAHNWAEGTRGRSPFANNIWPTFPNLDPNRVFMQVNPGQNFVVEWAPAHGDFTYFVALAAINESEIVNHNRTTLDDYLLNCPTNASQAGHSAKWQKYHFTGANIDITDTTGHALLNQPPANSDTFLRIVPPDDPAWWNRSCLFPHTICNQTGVGFLPNPGKCMNCRDVAQVQFLPAMIYQDARCSYYNPKYPWMLHVVRFQHNNYGQDVDAAQMYFPAGISAGRYQLHYLWSSYRDTIDVDVTTAGTVTNPYGAASNNTPYAIADHCMYEDATGWTGNCVQIVTTPEQCLQGCANTYCFGVQVIPLNGVPPFPANSQIPWMQNPGHCNRSWFTNAPANAFICYEINSYRDSANGALTPWTFFNDPDDIGFYGTCYIKESPRTFDFPLNPAIIANPADNPYQYGWACISCGDRGLQGSLQNAVDWHPTRNCVDCDTYFVTQWRTLGVTVPSWTLFGAGFFGVANKNCSSCIKWLSPMGSPYAMQDECAYLAANDPQCTSYVAYSDTQTQHCIGNYGFLYSDMTNMYWKTCACWKQNCCTNATNPTAPPILDPSASQAGYASGYSVYTINNS